MRILVPVAVILLALCGLAQADSSGHYGVRTFYDGFVYSRASEFDGPQNFYGVGANVSCCLGDRNTSLVADFSLLFKHESSLLYVLGGIRQTFPSEHLNGFVEGLAGLSYLNPKVGDSQTAPAYGFGGGIDWHVRDRLAIRLPQVDILWGNYKGEGFHDIRIQAGVSFPF